MPLPWPGMSSPPLLKAFCSSELVQNLLPPRSIQQAHTGWCWVALPQKHSLSHWFWSAGINGQTFYLNLNLISLSWGDPGMPRGQDYILEFFHRPLSQLEHAAHIKPTYEKMKKWVNATCSHKGINRLDFLSTYDFCYSDLGLRK